MKVFLSVLSFLLFAGSGFSQNTGDNPFPHRNYSMVTSQDAHYPGGVDSLSKWIYDNMNYPKEAMRKKLQADVTVSFEVLPDSTAANIITMNDPGNGFKEEAIRLISITKFAPAILKGRPIKQQMMFTIPFHLGGE